VRDRRQSTKSDGTAENAGMHFTVKGALRKNARNAACRAHRIISAESRVSFEEIESFSTDLSKIYRTRRARFAV